MYILFFGTCVKSKEDEFSSHNGPSATFKESTIYSILAVVSIIFNIESSKTIIESLFLTVFVHDVI
jgi:hypothetical protein